MSEAPNRKRAAPRRSRAVAGGSATTVANAVAAPPKTLIRTEIAVRWRDLDAFNHVNNAMFLTYVEEARLIWMDTLPEPWVTEHSAPLLASVTINYRRPVAWPETLSVELFTERIGNSSISIRYRISSAHHPALLYADGSSVMVWANKRTGKGAGLPDVVRRAASQ